MTRRVRDMPRRQQKAVMASLGRKPNSIKKPEKFPYEERKIRVYKYENAPPELKEKIREKWIEHDDLPQLPELMRDSLDHLLEKNKVKPIGEPEVGYSLTNSQGDGASFTGRFEWKGHTFSVSRENSRYVHERSTDVELEEDETTEKLSEKTKDKLYEDFKEKVVEIGEQLEDDGYSFIEDLQSEESLRDTFEANDYRFDEDGEIV